MKNLIRVTSPEGDWEAVYDGDTGKIITQGHSIRWEEDVLPLLGVKVSSVTASIVDMFPNTLDALKGDVTQ